MLKPVIQIVPTSSTPIKTQKPKDIRFERIKEFLQASNFAQNTQRSYQKELERFIIQVERTWHTVTPRDIAQYKRWLMEEAQNGKGKPLSPSSINQAITAIKSFYRWFQLSGYMDFTATLLTAAVGRVAVKSI